MRGHQHRLRLISRLLVSAVVLAGGTSRADVGASDGGRFIAGEARDVDDFLHACPTALFSNVSPTESCMVMQTYLLGSIGTQTFAAVRYGRDDSQRDTVNDVLVLQLTGNGRARPFWYDYSAIAEELIDTVDVIDTPGGPLFDISYCVNGTGGCWQKTFIRRSGTWKPLLHDQSWDPVYKQVPTPYLPHKSPPIDFRTMTWTQNLSGPSDANCCPSGSIEFKLAIAGDALHVESFRFVLPTPTPAPATDLTPPSGGSQR